MTKHYGKFMHHFGIPEQRAQAERMAKVHATGKGGFKGKAVVRVWKLVKEIEAK